MAWPQHGPVTAKTCDQAIRAARLCVGRQRKTPASHSAYSHAGSADVATMVNAKHLATLRQGVHAWNAWRIKESWVRPDLVRAELSGAELSGANLYRTNLHEADLHEADL